MREHRHPHPHIDPRQPRHGSRPGTNPPVFVWKASNAEGPFRLQVARDAAFKDICIDVAGLVDPTYLPEKAFAPGRYHWRWSGAATDSEVLAFEITPQAVVLEVPPAAEWLRRFPSGHPRLYVRPEHVPALRESRDRERADLWPRLQGDADALLAESHEIEEPPCLPDANRGYEEFFKAFSTVMWASRRFVRGAEALSLAYLASGQAHYARAACKRLDSMARWDPEGSSYLGHNDEAHMSIIWHGPTACDWVWDQFMDDERARVVEHLRRRGQITYEHMHARGSYGVTRFDSHAGREIVFLAQTALLIHEHAPEAAAWLEWLRPVLCGIWPVWAGDDGAWAEGPSYGLAYVNIMTIFATTLKCGAHVDLYSRPFWRNHARWRQHIFPAYAEWIGFGDHSERWGSSWEANADLVELIGRQTGTGEFDSYVAALRDEASRMSTPEHREAPCANPQLYILPRPEGITHAAAPKPQVHRIFPAAGWAAIRTHIDDPDRDVALIFRSSPYGAISHSHANNNDFIVHVAGKAMAMPSGYYDGYGSSHHTHWVWQTKSHNCVTLSGAGQIVRSHDSRGSVGHGFEDERIAYFRGNADASYADRAARCRRHVFLLKDSSCFVMVEEFVALPHTASALEWNIHSWNAFQVDEALRTFTLERDGRTLEGHFMWHLDAFFTLTDGWDPPPLKVKDASLWHHQYHLRFTPRGLPARQWLGVVLCPGHSALASAQVATERDAGVEVVRVGDAVVLISQGKPIEFEGVRSESPVLVVVGGCRYEVTDDGLRS